MGQGLAKVTHPHTRTQLCGGRGQGANTRSASQPPLTPAPPGLPTYLYKGDAIAVHFGVSLPVRRCALILFGWCWCWCVQDKQTRCCTRSRPPPPGSGPAPQLAAPRGTTSLTSHPSSSLLNMCKLPSPWRRLPTFVNSLCTMRLSPPPPPLLSPVTVASPTVPPRLISTTPPVLGTTQCTQWPGRQHAVR